MVSTTVLRVCEGFQNHEISVRVRYLVKGFQELAIRIPNEHDLHHHCVVINYSNPVLALGNFDLWAQPQGGIDKLLIPRDAVGAGRIPLESHYDFTTCRPDPEFT